MDFGNIVSKGAISDTSGGVIKAWVRFDMSDDTIDASYNVASLANVDSNTTRINWSNEFSSANYVCIGSTNGDDFLTFDTYNTGYVYCHAWDDDGSAVEAAEVVVVAIGAL